MRKASEEITGADFSQVLSSPTAAYDEGLAFFRGRGMITKTLKRLADDLERHGIDYSVIGAVALNLHGYRRFTEDIDLLLTKEGLEKFQSELVGRGYRPAFPGATKKFRVSGENVPLEIITTGEYPGDGRPKPVEFPDPRTSNVVIDGIKTIALEVLVELKVASGMNLPDRLKDLADVQELIRSLGLDAGFAEKLNPYVRDKYLELHYAIEKARAREPGIAPSSEQEWNSQTTREPGRGIDG